MSSPTNALGAVRLPSYFNDPRKREQNLPPVNTVEPAIPTPPPGLPSLQTPMAESQLQTVRKAIPKVRKFVSSPPTQQREMLPKGVQQAGAGAMRGVSELGNEMATPQGMAGLVAITALTGLPPGPVLSLLKAGLSYAAIKQLEDTVPEAWEAFKVGDVEEGTRLATHATAQAGMAAGIPAIKGKLPVNPEAAAGGLSRALRGLGGEEGFIRIKFFDRKGKELPASRTVSGLEPASYGEVTPSGRVPEAAKAEVTVEALPVGKPAYEYGTLYKALRDSGVNIDPRNITLVSKLTGEKQPLPFTEFEQIYPVTSKAATVPKTAGGSVSYKSGGMPAAEPTEFAKWQAKGVSASRSMTRKGTTDKPIVPPKTPVTPPISSGAPKLSQQFQQLETMFPDATPEQIIQMVQIARGKGGDITPPTPVAPTAPAAPVTPTIKPEPTPTPITPVKIAESPLPTEPPTATIEPPTPVTPQPVVKSKPLSTKEIPSSNDIEAAIKKGEIVNFQGLRGGGGLLMDRLPGTDLFTYMPERGYKGGDLPMVHSKDIVSVSENVHRVKARTEQFRNVGKTVKMLKPMEQKDRYILHKGGGTVVKTSEKKLSNAEVGKLVEELTRKSVAGDTAATNELKLIAKNRNPYGGLTKYTVAYGKDFEPISAQHLGKEGPQKKGFQHKEALAIAGQRQYKEAAELEFRQDVEEIRRQLGAKKQKPYTKAPSTIEVYESELEPTSKTMAPTKRQPSRAVFPETLKERDAVVEKMAASKGPQPQPTIYDAPLSAGTTVSPKKPASSLAEIPPERLSKAQIQAQIDSYRKQAAEAWNEYMQLKRTPGLAKKTGTPIPSAVSTEARVLRTKAFNLRNRAESLKQQLGKAAAEPLRFKPKVDATYKGQRKDVMKSEKEMVSAPVSTLSRVLDNYHTELKSLEAQEAKQGFRLRQADSLRAKIHRIMGSTPDIPPPPGGSAKVTTPTSAKPYTVPDFSKMYPSQVRAWGEKQVKAIGKKGFEERRSFNRQALDTTIGESNAKILNEYYNQLRGIEAIEKTMGKPTKIGNDIRSKISELEQAPNIPPPPAKK